MSTRIAKLVAAQRAAAILAIVACIGAHAADPPVQAPVKQDGIDWSSLLIQSLGFLAVEHSFRWVTEEVTRHPHRSFFDGYIDSLNSLHGWGDGDPFYVGYVGHPMEGAVAGFLFVQNDRRFRAAEFGRNRRYWKSRLRAAAYAWAYSEQFEIGPLSEASIGNVQAFFPQQGFVDQVATPAVGLAWMLAEDSMDRYVIKELENRIHNRYAQALIRSGLNPTRSMANLMAARVPWHRDTRPGVWESPRSGPAAPPPETGQPGETSTFEFHATTRGEKFVGEGSRGACIGGSGAATYRVGSEWRIVGDVSGCKLTNFGANLSGDSLAYMVGAHWTAARVRRWTPYAEILIGGRTLTHEQVDPAQKTLVEKNAALQGSALSISDHDLYTREAQVTGLAVSGHTGLDVTLTPAIAIRLGDIGYMHTWHSRLDDINYSNALQITCGLTVRFGTW